MPLTAVVLAAGAGTRLGEIGRRYSKPTVPVAGRPLIHWVVDMLTVAGIERTVIVGHPSDERLAQIVAGLKDTTLVHQTERRGIADALRCALPALAHEDAYLACAGDSLYPAAEVAALVDLGRRSPGTAVVGVLEMGAEATLSRSAVRLQGDMVAEIVEKPTPGSIASALVALPIYWLPRNFALQLEERTMLGTETYLSTALNRFRLGGGLVHAIHISTRLEITTVEDLERAEHVLAERGSGLGTRG